MIIVIVIKLKFVNETNEYGIKDLINFYKKKIGDIINRGVISLYLYKILHPPQLLFVWACCFLSSFLS